MGRPGQRNPAGVQRGGYDAVVKLLANAELCLFPARSVMFATIRSLSVEAVRSDSGSTVMRVEWMR
jgi:hypothetical protein